MKILTISIISILKTACADSSSNMKKNEFYETNPYFDYLKKNKECNYNKKCISEELKAYRIQKAQEHDFKSVDNPQSEKKY